MKAIYILFTIGALIPSSLAAQQCNPNTIFNNTSTNAVCTEVNGVAKYWYANQIPDHATGNFPNQGNPTAISAQQAEKTMCAYPQLAGSTTQMVLGFDVPGSCPAYAFGLANNGLEFDPIAAEWFENPNTGEINYEWNENALSPLINLGTDMNDAHVQPSGKYHYHGNPTEYINLLGISPTAHSPIIGYAADGFPLYYRYVFSDPNDSNSAIVEASTCFQLKAGNRPGNGTTAPDGPYDGRYVEDFEYVNSGGCLLDECNGRFAVTPDFPNGTYYYVLTEEFPVVPRCFKGTPDNSFLIGPGFAGCGVSNANDICSALTVSVDPELMIQEISVGPNPVQNSLLINTGYLNSGEIPNTIEILDGSGRLIDRLPFSTNVDASDLPTGVYHLRMSNNLNSITKRFVKN